MVEQNLPERTREQVFVGMSEASTPKGDVETSASRVNDPFSKDLPTSPFVGEPPSGATPFPIIPNYRIEQELGRGGMGVVYRAHDLRLNRAVALKMVIGGAVAGRTALTRFLAEAEALAALQHPYVVQVFDRGQFQESPFFTMEFCPGGSLGARVRKSTLSGRTAAELVEKLAHGVAAAHAQNILHRDLKPDNVLFAADGTPKITDFGLAKRFDDTGEGASDLTQTGAVMGTPSYMAPEQAKGETKRVGPAADIYALGAILYRLVAGRPPFVGLNSSDTIRQVIDNEPISPSVLIPGLPRDVATICLKCLGKVPAKRYLTANDLAADLRRFLNGQPIEARPVGSFERALKWVKRNPIIAGATTAIALTLAIGTTVSYLKYREAKFQEGIAIEKESLANSKAEELEVALDQASQNYQSALDAFEQMVLSIQTQLENHPNTQKLRNSLLANAREGMQKLLLQTKKTGRTDRILIWSHLQMGKLEQHLGNSLAAQAEYRIGHELAQSLVDADPNSPVAQRDLSVAFERLGDLAQQMGQSQVALDHYENALRIDRHLADNKPLISRAQRDLSVDLLNVSDIMLELGRTDEALSYGKNCLEIRERRANEYPKNNLMQSDLSNCFSRLGIIAKKRGRDEEAIDYFVRAARIDERLADENPNDARAQRELSGSFDQLGDIALDAGRTTEALGYYEKSLRIDKRVANEDPKNAEAQCELSTGFEKLGKIAQKANRPNEALAYFEKAYRIRQQLADADRNDAQLQRELSVSFDNLGDISLALKRTKDALDYFEKGLIIDQRLAEADPANAEKKNDLSVSLVKLGAISRQMGQLEAAKSHYEKAARICQQLVDSDPKNVEIKRELIGIFDTLGQVTLQLNRPKESLTYYEKCRSLQESLTPVELTEASPHKSLGAFCDKLGHIHKRLLHYPEALACYDRGRSIRQRLADAHPKDPVIQRDLSVSFERLGDTARLLGQPQAALVHFQRCLQLRQALANADPKNALFDRDLSIVYERLGDTYRELSQPNEALAHFQKCLPIRQHLADVDPKNVQSQRELALVFDRIGDVLYRERLASDAWNSYEAGRRIRQKSVDDEPTNSDSQRDLSISFTKLGDVATLMNRQQVAIANFEKSLQICQKLCDADPLKLSTQRELSFVLRRLASIQQRLGNFSIAEKWLHQAEKLAAEYSQPNFFPNDLPEIRKAILFGKKSEKTIHDIEAIFAEEEEAIPNLLRIRVQRLLATGNYKAAIQSTERFAEWAEKLKANRLGRLYDSACSFAICAADNKAERTMLVDRTLALLSQLQMEGYFTPIKIAHFKIDEDFDPLRRESKFAAFLQKLDKK